MALYALDAVDDAYRATTAFLRPVDRARWLKLALIGLFVGAPSIGTGGAQVNAPTGGGADEAVTDVSAEVWVALAVVAVLVLLVGLAVLFVGSVMEFVLVESLRSREVRIRSYWRRYLRAGVGLFAFRLALALVVLAGVAVLAALFLLPVALDGDPASAFVVVLLLVPLFVVLAVAAAVVAGFTTDFVVPVMMVEECGVVAGWRRFWSTLARDWTEFLAYAVARFFLALAGGFLVGVVTAVAVVLLLVPFGLLAAVAFAGFLLAEPLGIALFVGVGLIFVVAVVAVAAVVQVPVVTYLRYYSLLVLGDANVDFDLIPDQRGAVRD